MECIISGMLGMFIGMLIIAYITIGVINRKDRKISNQKAMIKNRDEVIDNQNEKIKLIKKAVEKGYYDIKTLENEIKSVLYLR